MVFCLVTRDFCDELNSVLKGAGVVTDHIWFHAKFVSWCTYLRIIMNMVLRIGVWEKFICTWLL